MCRKAKGGDRVRRAITADWLLAFGAAAWVAGCATVVPEPVVIREPRPEPIPLVVGVYYPEEFLGFVHREWRVERKVGALVPPFAVGEASVKLLDEALGLLFTQVVRMPGRPPGVPGASSLAGVIEPRIVGVSYTPPVGAPTKGVLTYTGLRATAWIAYGFTLYSVNGEQLASWEVRGYGVGVDSWHSRRAVLRSLEEAMREAAWEFPENFRSVPGVRRWLDANGVK